MTKHHQVDLSVPEQKLLASLHSTFPLTIIPNAIKPYAELIRISKPAGVGMFYYPFLYGVLLIGALDRECSTPEMLRASFHMGVLAFIMRATFCTWNDILDQGFDRQVARTRIRPLARRAVSTWSACNFLAMQSLLLGAYFRTLPEDCVVHAVPCLALHVMYPLAKRMTHHPQVVLGLAFANEIWIPLPLLGLNNILDTNHRTELVSVLGIGAALICWTLLFDTIYAAQDLKDDKRVGIGSTIVYWEAHAIDFLRVLVVLTVASLSVVSYTISQSSFAGSAIYSAISCVGGGTGLVWMVETVDLDDPGDCAWWFGTASLLFGFMVGSGLYGAHLGQIYY